MSTTPSKGNPQKPGTPAQPSKTAKPGVKPDCKPGPTKPAAPPKK
jgi:hypothetical protein